MKRLALAISAVVSLALLGQAPPVSAQNWDWVITYGADGTCKQYHSNWPAPWDWDVSSWYQPSGAIDYNLDDVTAWYFGGAPVSIEGKIEGSVSATARWTKVAAGPELLPPMEVGFLVEAAAGWAGWQLEEPGVVLGSHMAYDGLGDRYVVTGSLDNPGYFTGVSQGRHLYTVDGTSGVYKLERFMQVDVNAQNSSTLALPGFGPYVRFSMRRDDRTATLEGIWPSYYKGYDSNTGQPVRLQHRHLDDGCMIVDTVPNTMESELRDGVNVTVWSYNVNVRGALSGFPPERMGPETDKDWTYRWTATGFGAETLWDTTDLPGPPDYTHPKASTAVDSTRTASSVPNTTITLHVVDRRDGAVAEPSYTVQWHEPVENVVKRGLAAAEAPRLFSTSQEIRAGENVMLDVGNSPLSVDGWSAAALVCNTGSATAGALLESGPPAAILCAVLAAAGWAASRMEPPPPPPVPFSASLSQFMADAALQQRINAGTTNAGDPAPTAQRVCPPNVADLIGGDPELAASYFNGQHGAVTAKVTPGEWRWCQTTDGDAYDVNGYVGQATHFVHYPGAIFYACTWTVH